MKPQKTSFVAIVFLALCMTSAASHAAVASQSRIKNIVDHAIRPLMAEYGIPGMAVGVAISGKTYVFDYGVASTESRRPIASSTLFEIGSISKTFTATLAAYAQDSGDLSLSDKVGSHLPSLRDSKFGDVSLLNLGTHTLGGLPLQVPADIRNNDQLMAYFMAWRPAYAPGAYRTYSNLGIGMLGLITAQSMGRDFSALLEQRLFPALGLRHSYISIPATKLADYAQGYLKEGPPVRMAIGPLSAEAYGIKMTAADLIRFVEINMDMIKLDGKFQRAITHTHTGYFQAGVMTQDLIWEQYPLPVALKTLLEGNSPTMIFKATPVTEIKPPQAPRQDVWINKTGSTNGFGAYVAFMPEKKIGIVLLANKSFPVESRITAAYGIIDSLCSACNATTEAAAPEVER